MATATRGLWRLAGNKIYVECKTNPDTGLPYTAAIACDSCPAGETPYVFVLSYEAAGRWVEGYGRIRAIHGYNTEAFCGGSITCLTPVAIPFSQAMEEYIRVGVKGPFSGGNRYNVGAAYGYYGEGFGGTPGDITRAEMVCTIGPVYATEGGALPSACSLEFSAASNVLVTDPTTYSNGHDIVIEPVSGTIGQWKTLEEYVTGRSFGVSVTAPALDMEGTSCASIERYVAYAMNSTVTGATISSSSATGHAELMSVTADGSSIRRESFRHAVTIEDLSAVTYETTPVTDGNEAMYAACTIMSGALQDEWVSVEAENISLVLVGHDMNNSGLFKDAFPDAVYITGGNIGTDYSIVQDIGAEVLGGHVTWRSLGEQAPSGFAEGDQCLQFTPYPYTAVPNITGTFTGLSATLKEISSFVHRFKPAVNDWKPYYDNTRRRYGMSYGLHDMAYRFHSVGGVDGVIDGEREMSESPGKDDPYSPIAKGDPSIAAAISASDQSGNAMVVVDATEYGESGFLYEGSVLDSEPYISLYGGTYRMYLTGSEIPYEDEATGPPTGYTDIARASFVPPEAVTVTYNFRESFSLHYGISGTDPIELSGISFNNHPDGGGETPEGQPISAGTYSSLTAAPFAIVSLTLVNSGYSESIADGNEVTAMPLKASAVSLSKGGIGEGSGYPEFTLNGSSFTRELESGVTGVVSGSGLFVYEYSPSIKPLLADWGTVFLSHQYGAVGWDKIYLEVPYTVSANYHKEDTTSAENAECGAELPITVAVGSGIGGVMTATVSVTVSMTHTEFQPCTEPGTPIDPPVPAYSFCCDDGVQQQALEQLPGDLQ